MIPDRSIPGYPIPSYPIPVRPPETISMTTRDGTRLDADVYMPDAPGPFPVLLMRLPYGLSLIHI